MNARDRLAKVRCRGEANVLSWRIWDQFASWRQLPPLAIAALKSTLSIKSTAALRFATEMLGGAVLKFLIVATAAITAASCSAQRPDANSYTLYRTGEVALGVGGDVQRDLEAMRIHVASFDANLEEFYNRDNCQIAAGLFGVQEGVTSRYWCEKGRYRE